MTRSSAASRKVSSTTGSAKTGAARGAAQSKQAANSNAAKPGSAKSDAAPPATMKARAPAAPAAQAKAEPPAAPKEKIKKPKLVRDSFTMPEAEYQVLGDVKKACLKAGMAVKKSELLRVGVALIRKLEVAELKRNLAGLTPLKAGRPKKDK